MNVYLLLREVYPFLVLFLLLDGVKRIPPYRRLLYSWSGRRFRIGGSGFVFASPLPSSRTYFTSAAGMVPSTHGLLVLRKPRLEVDLSHPLAFREIAYGEAERIRSSSSRLFLGDDPIASEGSPAEAKRRIDQVASFRDAPESDRLGLLREHLSHRTSVDRIRRKASEFQAHVGAVELCSWLLFAFLFVVLPMFLYGPPAARGPLSAGSIGGLALIAYAGLLLVGWRAQRTLFGSRTRWDRFLPVVLSPVTAVHLPAHLGEEWFAEFDPTAVALVLQPGEGTRARLRREYWRARQAAERATHDSVRSFWEVQSEALASLAKEANGESGWLEDPPPGMKAGDLFCPICESEFAPGRELCPDCSALLRPGR